MADPTPDNLPGFSTPPPDGELIEMLQVDGSWMPATLVWAGVACGRKGRSYQMYRGIIGDQHTDLLIWEGYRWRYPQPAGT